MRLFLTSSPCSPYPQEDGRILYGYSKENGFLERFCQGWEPGCQCVMISSDPGDFGHNDKMRGEFEGFFQISGIPVSRLVMVDDRNEGDLSRLLSESSVVILAGGHVPTQNRFFRRIKLKERIQGYAGVVMGISAGTMNCADTVYAQPELAGESLDLEYQRFLPGLGLTGRMILPHYQETRDRILDGRRLMEDITYGDSVGQEFYALVDGSYVLCEYGQETLYGEAWKIWDGKIEKVCDKGEKIAL